MQSKGALVLTALAASLLLAACNNSKDPLPEVPGNVLLDGNRLSYMDFSAPAFSLSTLGTVTGLTSGDTLVSIDRRPQNGFLYGLGYNSIAGSVTLYVIHPETLVATSLGLAGGFIDGLNPVAIGGNNAATRFEMDFNPAVDRVRVINSLGQNFRMNPNTGTVVDGDLGGTAGSVNGTNMDGALNGGATAAQGTAYVNNVANNGGITTQYTINENPGTLFIQNPPNAGTLSTPPLTITPSVKTILGFDIAPGVTTTTSNSTVASGSGYLLLRTAAFTPTSLASVNLVTGALSGITAITGGASARGLAVQSPASMAVIALSADGTQLIRFAAATPGLTTFASPPPPAMPNVITGVTAGESLVGIDFRPATGQLFALGVNAAMNNGTIYRLDPQTGVATVAVAGTVGSIAFVDASNNAVDLPDPATAGYGFDFNPVVDRIRVTTSTGLNFRIDQTTGLPLDGNAATGVNPDGGINNGVTITGASGSAYTNSVAGTAFTTLYALSEAGSQLTIQNQPNAGTQTLPLTVRLNGSPLVFTNVNGFDIPSDVRAPLSNAAVTSGSGFAALKVGATTQLYRIDLVTGAATNLGTIGAGADLRGLAVGQTHVR